MLLADRTYDSDKIRDLVRQGGAWANTPPRRNRRNPICFSPHLYRDRNHVERFFNRSKHCRRSASRYAKLADIFLAFIKLAAIRLWLGAYESKSQCIPAKPRDRQAGRSRGPLAPGYSAAAKPRWSLAAGCL